MGGTFSSRRTKPESADISGGRWSNIECYNGVRFKNARRFAISLYSEIALIVLLFTFLWNKVIIKSSYKKNQKLFHLSRMNYKYQQSKVFCCYKTS